MDNVSTGAAPVQSAAIETPQVEGQSTEQSPVGAAPQTKEEKKAEAKKVKQLKLKVNQKEIVEDLPFEVDEAHAEWMAKNLQKAKAFDGKAQEYSQLERDVVEFMELLRTNPKKALSNPDFGIDVKKLAAEIIEEQIALAQKSPEEIEKEKLKAELEEIKAQRKREAEEAKKTQQQLLEEKALKDYDEQVTNVLKKNNLPKNRYTVNKMAMYMLDALDKKINVTPEDIVHLVKEDLTNDWKELVGGLPEEQLEQFIGEDIFDKVRKKNIAKVKQNQPKPNLKQTETKAKEPQKKIPFKDFFKGV